MNCPRCGAVHQPGAPMCPTCGTPLTVSYGGAAPLPAYAAPPPYAPPQAAPQPYAQPAGYPPAAPSPYAAPGYPPAAPYGAPAPPYDPAAYPYVAAAPKTSAMAVIGFILAFLCNFVGLILSIIALVRISRSNGQLRGKSLAIAGIILAAIFLVVGIVYQISVAR